MAENAIIIDPKCVTIYIKQCTKRMKVEPNTFPNWWWPNFIVFQYGCEILNKNKPKKKAIIYNSTFELFEQGKWASRINLRNSNFIFYYSYIEVGTLSEVILPTLLTCINVHLDTIHRKECSSWYYSVKTLFIASFSLKILTLLIVFLLFILALFIIRINATFFLFSKFLPTKVILWHPCHIVNVEHTLNHVP